MAREMNVNKRIDVLKRIVHRTETHGTKAARIAAELNNSFKDDRTPKGKAARDAARTAERISKALAKAAASVSV